MPRLAVLLIIAAGLAGCDALSTLTDGWKYAKAVETELEASTGMRPGVGFSWKNARLETVTITFPRLYDAKPLPQLAETVRRAVGHQFKQVPGTILLAFALEKSDPRATARRNVAELALVEAAPQAGTPKDELTHSPSGTVGSLLRINE
jgi:hypothetical protein